jgi:DNA-binding beta-propeller fold protein YncE
MKKLNVLYFLLFLIGCKYDTAEQPTVPVDPVAASNYPVEIGNILVNKCATSGCHNSLSRGVAGGLDFSSWDQMFDGGRNGTAVIPYSVENSYLLYSVNTDTTLGPVLEPTMPYLGDHISSSEYNSLVNWIASGAPDKNGVIKFSDNPDRRKLYIVMQGCDKVAVVDEATKVIMRYIDVGNKPNQIESPHQVRVSPDGQYWYAVFYTGDILQKFRTSDDSFVGEVNITSATWNTLVFSASGDTGFVNGTIEGVTAVVNLNSMTLQNLFTISYPHGGLVTPDGKTMYITSQNGNFLTKIDLTTAPFYDNSIVVLVPGASPSTSTGNYDPHEITLTPDGLKYMVSCQASNEVRVFQLDNDSLLAVINVGKFPQEFTVMPSMNKVYVSCTEAPVDANKKGLVYSIDCSTYETDSVYPGFQPHGLAADDNSKLVYVANLNADPTGPAPHHASSCSGRNGNLTIIDASTMTLFRKQLSDGSSFQYKCELLPAPYFISLRE